MYQRQSQGSHSPADFLGDVCRCELRLHLRSSGWSRMPRGWFVAGTRAVGNGVAEGMGKNDNMTTV